MLYASSEDRLSCWLDIFSVAALKEPPNPISFPSITAEVDLYEVSMNENSQGWIVAPWR